MYTFSFVDCREQERFNTYRNEFDSKPWWMTRLITMFLKTHTNRPHIVSNQTRIWYVVFIFWFLVVILVPFIDSISAYQTKICIITKHIIYFWETRRDPQINCSRIGVYIFAIHCLYAIIFVCIQAPERKPDLAKLLH